LITRKKKYYYNPATLTFDEIRPSRKHRTGVLLAGFIFFLFTSFAGFLVSYSGKSAKVIFLEKKLSDLTAQLGDLLKRSGSYENIIQSAYFPADNLYRTILSIDTIPLSMMNGGTGGSADPGLVYRDQVSGQLRSQIDKLYIQLQMERLSFENVYNKAVEQKIMFRCLPAIQPLAINDVLYISSYFGSRTDPFNYEDQQIHTGIDFVASVGVNVYATGDGIVTLAKNSRTGYGNEIVIDHAFGYSSRYAHLHDIFVKEGEEVIRGQLIGKVGNSGRSTGPHLHYEVRFENKAVNPVAYFEDLKPEEYNEILALANKGN
jgi:murein DD-endopeptidase MepM/ murein hydrolase activator NlpD